MRYRKLIGFYIVVIVAVCMATMVVLGMLRDSPISHGEKITSAYLTPTKYASESDIVASQARFISNIYPLIKDNWTRTTLSIVPPSPPDTISIIRVDISTPVEPANVYHVYRSNDIIDKITYASSGSMYQYKLTVFPYDHSEKWYLSRRFSFRIGILLGALISMVHFLGFVMRRDFA